MNEYMKIDREQLYWDFIKSMDMVKEFRLWELAILDKNEK